MKKAIFFDIDGTLLDVVHGWTKIQEPVKNAIHRLQVAGHMTFIATGRPYPYLSDELKNFGFDGFILMNGAGILWNGKTIFHQALPKESVQEILRLSEEEQIEYILQDADRVYLKKEYTNLEKFYERLGISTKNFVREFDPEEIHTCKIELIALEASASQSFDRMLAQPGVAGWIDPFHGRNLEIYGNIESKGSAIGRILQKFDIPREDSYAFGDGLNDLEMMESVGMSFAMENGCDEAKALAKHIVPSVREHGVAFGIERYIL